jgi:PilZ domain
VQARYPWRLIEHRQAHDGKACTQRKDGAAAKFQHDHGCVAGTMRAICAATMSSREAGGRAPGRQASELRRYSREVRPWPVVLETRDGLLRLPLIDLSPGGAKVRLTEPLKEGTKGRLYFLPPHWRPRAVEAIVWRIDLDGVVLRFNSPNIAPSPAARDVRPPDSWLWTWEAQATT